MMQKGITRFDVFEDRAVSLLKRWKQFREGHPDTPDIDKVCIQGVLREMDDGFTQLLINSCDEEAAHCLRDL